jgi:hypothetical protein
MSAEIDLERELIDAFDRVVHRDYPKPEPNE